jgi:hypothetical protein
VQACVRLLRCAFSARLDWWTSSASSIHLFLRLSKFKHHTAQRSNLGHAKSFHLLNSFPSLFLTPLSLSTPPPSFHPRWSHVLQSSLLILRDFSVLSTPTQFRNLKSLVFLHWYKLTIRYLHICGFLPPISFSSLPPSLRATQIQPPCGPRHTASRLQTCNLRIMIASSLP